MIKKEELTNTLKNWLYSAISFLKKSYIILILICTLILLFILISTSSLKIITNQVTMLSMKDNNKVHEFKVNLPFYDDSSDIKEYLFKIKIHKNIFSNGSVSIMHDDTITSIKVNKEEVSLDRFKNNQLSDVYSPLRVNIGKYLKNGENTLEIKIKDIGGRYGLDVKNSSMDPGYTALIMLIILNILAIGIIGIILLLKNKEKLIDEKDIILEKDNWIIRLIFIVIILSISFFTFFYNYQNPSGIFWDENYHIASAQKYIDNVMFMECHPPLGKLFIALGEIILNPNKNIDKSSFLKTDYIRNVPAGYSFAGVRLFSTLFSSITPVLLFLIFIYIFKNPLISFCFSSLYLFENAIILHSRSAMLEGTQIFFILLSIFYFIYVHQTKKDTKEYSILNYFILGLFAGLTIAIKMNGAIILLLFVFLAFSEYWPVIINKNITLNKIIKFFLKVVVSICGILLIFFSVWYIHFNLGKKIVNLRTYKASKEYIDIMGNKTQANPLNFYVMFRDNWKFMKIHHEGVPKLNECSPTENGSYPLGWPIGRKGINYRWEKTKNGLAVKYLYLQGNPIVWFTGFFSVLLSIILIGGRLFFKLEIKNKNIFTLIVFFTLLYLSYMASILSIERVMYLYHYFIPLLFALILSFLIFIYFFELYLYNKKTLTRIILTVFFLMMLSSYLWFSPFTYFKPLTTSQFNQRAWLKIWKLKPIK